jgi:hypothetical protein
MKSKKSKQSLAERFKDYHGDFVCSELDVGDEVGEEEVEEVEEIVLNDKHIGSTFEDFKKEVYTKEELKSFELIVKMQIACGNHKDKIL